jgi:excisionase family DNA binding protein
VTARRENVYRELSRESDEKIGPALLTVQQVSEYTGIAVKTLYNWGSTRKGPPRVKVGGRLRYRATDLQAWLESQTS